MHAPAASVSAAVENGSAMPHVTISVVGPEPTKQQKVELFAKITDLMVEVLGRTRKLVTISVGSWPVSAWAVGGEPLAGPGFKGVHAIIRLVEGTSTDQQKARMIEEVSAVLRTILGEPVLPLYVVIDDVPATAWGYGGQTVAALRAKAA